MGRGKRIGARVEEIIDTFISSFESEDSKDAEEMFSRLTRASAGSVTQTRRSLFYECSPFNLFKYEKGLIEKYVSLLYGITAFG